MNVGQLREMLEDYDDDAPVLLATQPSWPLAFRVSGIVNYEDAIESGAVADDDDDDETTSDETRRDTRVVWIVAGDHPRDDPYAPQWCWNV